MDETLYIRIRGRVQGPFDREKPQLLARRGQLSRIHEVSSDGVAWRKAGEYPDLFAAPVASAVAAPRSEGRNGGAAAAPAAPSEPQWYYARNGAQHGPVRFAELQRLAATGQLAPSDSVWCEGMAEWMLVQQAPGLMPAPLALPAADYARKEETRQESRRRGAESELSENRSCPISAKCPNSTVE